MTTLLTNQATEKTISAPCIKGGKLSSTTIRYAWTRSPAGVPALTIAAGKSTTSYFVREFDVDPEFRGRGFQLTKVGSAESYNVLVCADASNHLCDCRGNEAHSRCKHVAVLFASWDRGELPGDEPLIEAHPSQQQVDDESDFGSAGAEGSDCPF